MKNYKQKVQSTNNIPKNYKNAGSSFNKFTLSFKDQCTRPKVTKQLKTIDGCLLHSAMSIEKLS